MNNNILFKIKINIKKLLKIKNKILLNVYNQKLFKINNHILFNINYQKLLKIKNKIMKINLFKN